jgi:CheY-like chemotaxis protein
LVDDEPPIRKLLRLGLRAHGYHVIEATNGKNALELLGKSPDIIILDLGLPDMQGHDLLRMIRGRKDAARCDRHSKPPDQKYLGSSLHMSASRPRHGCGR